MPVVLAALIAAAFLLSRRQAHAAENAPTSLPSSTVLLPGAAAFLPPIVAPESLKILYANAMASGNPILLAQAAQAMMAHGQVQLAQALSARNQQLTNQPLPGVPPMQAAAGMWYGGLPGMSPMGAAAGAWWGPRSSATAGSALVAIGAMADPRVLALVRRMAQARRARGTQRGARLLQALHASRHC